MKTVKVKFSIRVVCLLLALAALACVQVSCKEKAPEVVDPVVECGDYKLPLCFYELMLSRAKGNLAREKFEVTKYSFWSGEYLDTSKTYEEYFNGEVLETCKNYLAAAVLFDREGLELSESKLAEIDEEIQFYIDYDGKGDREKFDSLIEKYGVDADSLRECYIIEAKYEAVMSKLFGGGQLIGDAVRDEYYREYYYRFKQVLFPKFYYEYRRDVQGNVMYFNPDEAVPIYDEKNGKCKYDDKGNRITDSYNQVIYYDEDGKIIYNTEKGQPSVLLDEKGTAVMHEYSAAELEAFRDQAIYLVENTGKGDYSAFDAKVAANKLIEGVEAAYPDGYYLSEIEKAGYVGDSAYLCDILALLQDADVGEITFFESDFGYHVIMKYELDDGKTSNGEYAEWFSKLDTRIMNDLFITKIGDILKEITVNEENISKARSIKQMGVNYNY